MKYTPAWRGRNGELFYRPLTLKPKEPKDFFDGYELEEFGVKIAGKAATGDLIWYTPGYQPANWTPVIFPLPVELIPAAHELNGNNENS